MSDRQRLTAEAVYDVFAAIGAATAGEWRIAGAYLGDAVRNGWRAAWA